MKPLRVRCRNYITNSWRWQGGLRRFQKPDNVTFMYSFHFSTLSQIPLYRPIASNSPDRVVTHMSKYVHMFETSYICQNSKYVHMLPVPNMWTNLVREYSKVPPPPKDPNPPIVTLFYLLYWYSCSSKDPPPDYRNSPHIHDTQNLVTADIRCTQVLSIRSQF